MNKQFSLKTTCETLIELDVLNNWNYPHEKFSYMTAWEVLGVSVKTDCWTLTFLGPCFWFKSPRVGPENLYSHISFVFIFSHILGWCCYWKWSWGHALRLFFPALYRRVTSYFNILMIVGNPMLLDILSLVFGGTLCCYSQTPKTRDWKWTYFGWQFWGMGSSR